MKIYFKQKREREKGEEREKRKKKTWKKKIFFFKPVWQVDFSSKLWRVLKLSSFFAGLWLGLG